MPALGEKSDHFVFHMYSFSGKTLTAWNVTYIQSQVVLTTRVVFKEMLVDHLFEF